MFASTHKHTHARMRAQTDPLQKTGVVRFSDLEMSTQFSYRFRKGCVFPLCVLKFDTQLGVPLSCCLMIMSHLFKKGELFCISLDYFLVILCCLLQESKLPILFITFCSCLLSYMSSIMLPMHSPTSANPYFSVTVRIIRVIGVK